VGKRGIDWELIRDEYITGSDTVTVRSLAHKHGVDQATVSGHSKREQWVALRQAHRQRVASKARESVITAQAGIRKRQMELGQRMQELGRTAMAQLAKRVKNADGTDRVVIELDATEARLFIKDGSEIERKAAGIPEDGSNEVAVKVLAAAMRHCTDEELDEWSRTGQPPARISGLMSGSDQGGEAAQG
jgi:hypothetical protein